MEEAIFFLFLEGETENQQCLFRKTIPQQRSPFLRMSGAKGCSEATLRSGPTTVVAGLYFGLPVMPSLEGFNCWQ